MTSTTLITFLLQAPATTKSVDLLGSWDNFSRAYPLQRDLRTGTDCWRGCHTFKNIICDGQSSVAAVGRDGGLKMGETYWYFYRLNDDTEYHDPARPFTTYCPFLPGQPINILDVPIQSSQPNSSNNEVLASFENPAIFTMNPEDKFLTPRPAFTPAEPESPQSQSPTTTGPMPRAGGLCKPISLPAEKKEPSLTRPASAPGSFQYMPNGWPYTKEMTRSCSLYSLIKSHKGRDLQHADQTRSHRLPSRVLMKRRPTLWINPNLPLLGSNAGPKSCSSATLSAPKAPQPKSLGICLQKSNRFANAAPRSSTISVSVPAHVQQKTPAIASNYSPFLSRSNGQPLEYARENACSAPATPLFPYKAALLGDLQTPSALAQTIPRDSEGESAKSTNFASLTDPSYDIYDTTSQDCLMRRASCPGPPPSQEEKCLSQDVQNTHRATSSIESLRAGGDVFTPSLTICTIDTGLTSPLPLVDPDASSPSDFGHLAAQKASPQTNPDSTTWYRDTDALQAYTSPPEIKESTLALRNSPLANHGQGPGLLLQQQSNIRVHAWNDGSGQGNFDIDEIFNDLSYLGAMIV